MRGKQRKACCLVCSSQMKLEWEKEADQKYIRDDTTKKEDYLNLKNNVGMRTKQFKSATSNLRLETGRNVLLRTAF